MRFLGSWPHTGFIALAHVLAFCSFGILLGGVAAMQQACGSGVDIRILGLTDYLAPTSCDRLYSFDWFILFFQGFVWLVLLPVIFGRQIHKSRNMSTGLLIVASILLCFMTNTWYRAWSGIPAGTTSSTYNKRAKVTFSGALIGAVADLLMIMFIGMHDEKTPIEERTRGRGEQGQFQTSYVPTGAMPGATPAHVATTQAETVGYREGPVATEPAATATAI